VVDKELRDEKAVHVAVNRIKNGAYVIDVHANDHVEEENESEEAEPSEETVTDAE
jgi:hypothetical protein